MNADWREQRRQERWERRQQWRAGHHPNPMGGAIFGLILIGGGLMFLLRNLGILYFDSIWQYWPVILIAIGVSKIFNPRHPGQILPGVILTGVGGIFLLRSLGIIYGNMWGFIWPAFFIAVGISLLLRNMSGTGWGAGGGPVGIVDDGGSDANRLNVDIVFGGIERKMVSQAFEGGKIAVVFGGANIDLRGAAMQVPEITLHADAVFGGIDLKVPESWQVDMRGSGFFGGYEDRTHRPAPNVSGQPHPRLIVRGGAVFGGVTVRN